MADEPEKTVEDVVLAVDRCPTKEVVKLAKKMSISMALEDPTAVAEFLEAWAKRIRETGCIDVVIPVGE